jgi:hypothetical protein
LDAQPWRTFKWYHGQRNYLGLYWSATERRHLIYESRHELAHLLCADFDASVTRITTQPFRLEVRSGGRIRHHVPDFLLLLNGAPMVVDVTLAHRLSEPRTAFTIEWTKLVMEKMDWRYEVLTGVDPVRLANVRFLAGYRRQWLIDADALTELRSCIDDLDAQSIGAVAIARPAALVRSALLHLLWTQELLVDLDEVLGPDSMLRRP